MIDNGDIISVNTDYNYGAKAQDIGISGSYSILPDQHAVDAYKDYSFGIDAEAVNNGNYTKFAQIDSGNTNQMVNLTLHLKLQMRTILAR